MLGAAVDACCRRRRRTSSAAPLSLLAAAAAAVVFLSVKARACSVDGGQLQVTVDDVPEQLPTGTVVGTLRFDAPASIRSLQTTKPSPNFAFNSTNYKLFVTHVLDIDNSSSEAQPQHMQIGCENLQGIPFEIDVWFYVTDINDNAPLFLPSNRYVFNVSEALPVFSEVGQVHAMDADRDNLNIEYRIQPGAHSLFFSLQGKAGGYAAIKLAQVLDFEAYQQLTIQVLAMDCPNSGCQNDRRTSAATVIVNIRDADDQNPEFVGTPYEATIFDNTTAGSTVLQVHAIDLDVTLNSTLRYDMIVDDITRDVFQVNNLTGVVMVKNPTLLQKDFLYLLQLKVSQVDDPAKRDSTTVVIRVMPASCQGPHLDRKLYEVYVMENALVPMKLLTLVVSGAVEDQEVLLFSLDASNYSTMFSIEQGGPHVGELYLRQPLDFERQNRYEMLAKVSNFKQQEDTTTIAVNVIDANDNNPQFDAAQYEFDVNSTVCGAVHATDRDAGTVLTYRIVGGRFSELFSVSVNGELHLKGNQPDYTSDTYSFTVLAMDDGRPPRTGAAVVTLNLKSYLASYRGSAVAQAASTDGYVSYALGAVAAVLLIAVVILVLCLARGSLHKRRKNRSCGGTAMRIDDHIDDGVDEETAIRPLDGCTYLAMSRLSADHMTVDYSEAKDSGLSDDAGSHCHHRMSNGHCQSSASDSKVHEADLQMLMSEMTASEQYHDGGPVRARRREDSLLLLSPPPPHLWQPVERSAYDGGSMVAARVSMATATLPADDKPADRSLRAAGDSSDCGGAAVASGVHEWRGGGVSASRGASTSSTSSSRSSAAQVYEERSVTAPQDAAATGSGSVGLPAQQKVVMRKSSLLARSAAQQQQQQQQLHHHHHRNCTRPGSASGAADGRASSSGRKQQQQLQLSAAAGSPQQKRVPLRKKQLVTNKDSLLYGDQADTVDSDLSTIPFVRQCSLSPSTPAGSRKSESNR